MAFKDLLLALNTYPEPTPVSAVQRAVDLARVLDARVSAVACEVTIRLPGRYEFLANAMLDVPKLIAAETKKSTDHARALLDAFEAAARGERDQTDVMGERLVSDARRPRWPGPSSPMRGCAILPSTCRCRRAITSIWSAKSVISGSGHPTLVLAQSAAAGPSAATLGRGGRRLGRQPASGAGLVGRAAAPGARPRGRGPVRGRARGRRRPPLRTERLTIFAAHDIAAQIHTEHAARRSAADGGAVLRRA